MGYWMFIFHYQQWYELYEKNCSLKTQDEWYAEGKPNICLGLIYFLTALIFELSYLPLMFAMIKREFFQYPCYKFMFMMGIYDIFILPCNGIITGIQVMKGEHFCNNPILYYFTSVIGGVGFYGVTTLCVILAFDRFLEMSCPKIATYVFGGSKTYLWMCIPIIYQCYIGFQLPHIFSIKIYAMHPDPYHLIYGMENNPNFNFQVFQTFFAWNNSLIIAFLTFFYGGILIVTKTGSNIKLIISKAQKQINKDIESYNLPKVVFQQWLYSDLRESTRSNLNIPAVTNSFPVLKPVLLQLMSILDISESCYSQYRSTIMDLSKDNSEFCDPSEIPQEKKTTKQGTIDMKEFLLPPKKKPMLMFEFSDGNIKLKAVLKGSVHGLDDNTLLGAKVLLLPKILCCNRVMKLTSENCQFLGGFNEQIIKENSHHLKSIYENHRTKHETDTVAFKKN